MARILTDPLGNFMVNKYNILYMEPITIQLKIQDLVIKVAI